LFIIGVRSGIRRIPVIPFAHHSTRSTRSSLYKINKIITLQDQQDHHSTRSTRPPDALRELQLHWAAKQPKPHQYQPGSQSPIIPRINRITKRRVSDYRPSGSAASHLGRHHPLGLSIQPSSSARTEPITNQGALIQPLGLSIQPTSAARTEPITNQGALIQPLGLSIQPTSSARTEPITNQGALTQTTSAARTEPTIHQVIPRHPVHQ
jgi:hypothetical protein